MAIERAYWSARKTVERAAGRIIFNVGNSLALHGYEKVGELLANAGVTMAIRGSISHRPFQVDPEILNPDGSLNERAWRDKMARRANEIATKGQDYYWQPGWQADERKADADIRDGRVQTFSSAAEAIRFLIESSRQNPKNPQ